MKILSIDPGFRILGYSVLEKNDKQIRLVFADEFCTQKTFSSIYDFVTDIVKEYEPHYAAIEKTFINCNPKTSIVLSQAQGVCLLAFEKAKVNFLQVAPTAVKKQIQAKVKEIFNKDFKENAADAIAIGVYLLCEDLDSYSFIV
jgi:crossover junction endodeoxyribonuclease RuvC